MNLLFDKNLYKIKRGFGVLGFWGFGVLAFLGVFLNEVKLVSHEHDA